MIISAYAEQNPAYRLTQLKQENMLAPSQKDGAFAFLLALTSGFAGKWSQQK